MEKKENEKAQKKETKDEEQKQIIYNRLTIIYYFN